MDLRLYQIDRAAEIATRVHQFGIAYVAMETRTGKTLTALEAIKTLGYKFVLFVTKKAVIPSIESDYDMGGYREFFQLKVTNYEQLHSLEVREFPTDIRVLDEAHRLGSFPKPCRAASVLYRQHYAHPTILMSATPAPESWSQMFHQIWATKCGMWGYRSFYDWVKDGYVSVRDRRIGQRTIMDYSHADIDRIREELDPIMVRQTQEDAGFNFTVNERLLRVPMSRHLMRMFDQMRTRHFITLPSGKQVTADTAASLLGKSHQIVSGTVIRDDTEGEVLDYSKAAAIRRDAAQRGYNKIAVYYKYKAEKQAIEKIFGDDLTDKWTLFQRSCRHRVYYKQIISGREGIRLDRAQAIYIYNIDFAWLSYAQTRERVQSFERTTPPELVWVMASYPDGAGLEDRIYNVVMNKRKYTSAFFRRDFL